MGLRNGIKIGVMVGMLLVGQGAWGGESDDVRLMREMDERWDGYAQSLINAGRESSDRMRLERIERNQEEMIYRMRERDNDRMMRENERFMQRQFRR